MRWTPRAASTGRKIDLKYQADDTGNPTNDTTQGPKSRRRGYVFAVVGVGNPVLHRGLVLGAEGVPAFGYLVSQDWNKHPDLFVPTGPFSTTRRLSPGLVDK